MKISIVLPCKNEEWGLGLCINKIKEILKNKEHEIIVSDSSSDSSEIIARKLGARVVKHKEGYGNALITGMNSASGDYIIFADCDCSYDFYEIPLFLRKFEEGYDIIIGSRMKGKIEWGAMPFSHRYIGNPFFTFLINFKFKSNFSDTHSGFRGVTKEAYNKLSLNCKGMEFASEMLIKAKNKNLKITEVPIRYSVRVGKKKLRMIKDGFRHLSYILKYENCNSL